MKKLILVVTILFSVNSYAQDSIRKLYVEFNKNVKEHFNNPESYTSLDSLLKPYFQSDLFNTKFEKFGIQNGYQFVEIEFIPSYSKFKFEFRKSYNTIMEEEYLGLSIDFKDYKWLSDEEVIQKFKDDDVTDFYNYKEVYEGIFYLNGKVLDSLKFEEMRSEFNNNFNTKYSYEEFSNKNRFNPIPFGSSCFFGGSQTKYYLEVQDIIRNKDREKAFELTQDLNSSVQFIGAMSLLLLEKEGVELNIKEKERIQLIRKINPKIVLCSGCTVQKDKFFEDLFFLDEILDYDEAWRLNRLFYEYQEQLMQNE